MFFWKMKAILVPKKPPPGFTWNWKFCHIAVVNLFVDEQKWRLTLAGFLFTQFYFLCGVTAWDVSSFSTSHLSGLAPANPYPSIHLTPEKMRCKYFGVSSYLLRLQPGSNHPCLFTQLKLFVSCFSALLRLFSVWWNDAPTHPPHPPPSLTPACFFFCACVFLEAKIDKPGAELS